MLRQRTVHRRRAPRGRGRRGQSRCLIEIGGDLDSATVEIRARFNVNLGSTGCFTGVHFYLGLDNNHGNDVDLVTIATHELAHGLGFDTTTDGSTGAELSLSNGPARPSIFDDFLLDTTTGLLWKDMTDAQRVASAINPRKVVWNGLNVTTAVPQVLAPGTPLFGKALPVSEVRRALGLAQ